ncbi:MAG: hypothetical protein UT24_C0016G0046 [Candidatus Woesebacteria bacterium GW2011_GWB1_39_12]|uniref:Uncharacterized protein n=1 Tax=Candidatus Woesebacteria bacterium GW2011_GWB1_39_12 TaxID=1618574 RepID=A0A0G0QEM7_9BACT|nr:MAG: hypothetical protein UT24_C0016G0046 [Candidatus Woesebacteria bacterium GW2011_GWB1_39_12]
MKKYQVTKKQCQKHIDQVNNVCDRCGRKIVPIKTVDNSHNPTYWAGCFHGSKDKDAFGNFTYGVPKETYKLAYKLVLQDNLYLGMKKEKGSDFEYLFQNGVSKICGILNDIEYIKNNKPRYTKTQLRKDYIKYYK